MSTDKPYDQPPEERNCQDDEKEIKKEHRDTEKPAEAG